MLARPLARPGPRCSSVAAALPFMRYQPSAAPVATPSKSTSTLRRLGFSSAARKCISDVPGFAKQTSMPSSASVATRLSEPFNVVLPTSWVKISVVSVVSGAAMALGLRGHSDEFLCLFDRIVGADRSRHQEAVAVCNHVIHVGGGHVGMA